MTRGSTPVMLHGTHSSVWYSVHLNFIVIKLLIVISIFQGITTLPILFPDSSEDNSTVSVMSVCPKGTWYYNETDSCWPSKKQGPCPSSLIFYAQDRKYGDCECPRIEGNHRTVWVYNLTLNRCFKSYEQAYCKSGEWIIFDKEGEPVCVSNKCEQMQRENPEENESHPVVLFNEICVRVSKPTFEGNCKSPYEIIISLQSGKPFCSSNTTSYGIGTTSNFKCRPGTRRDRLGKCRPLNSKVTFRPSS